jgi:hypothetical protein
LASSSLSVSAVIWLQCHNKALVPLAAADRKTRTRFAAAPKNSVWVFDKVVVRPAVIVKPLAGSTL